MAAEQSGSSQPNGYITQAQRRARANWESGVLALELQHKWDNEGDYRIHSAETENDFQLLENQLGNDIASLHHAIGDASSGPEEVELKAITTALLAKLKGLIIRSNRPPITRGGGRGKKPPLSVRKKAVAQLNRIGRGKRIAKKGGKGVINTIINKLPLELHAPGGYHYLGPGTRYEERRFGHFGQTVDPRNGIKHSDPINDLDAAAMEHDQAYTTHKDVPNRTVADKVLREKAQKIYRDKSKGWKQRGLAFATDKIFAVKNKLGMGVKKKKKKKKGGNVFTYFTPQGQSSHRVDPAILAQLFPNSGAGIKRKNQTKKRTIKGGGIAYLT